MPTQASKPPIQLIEKDILNKVVIAVDFNWDSQGAKPKHPKRKFICVQCEAKDKPPSLKKYTHKQFLNCNTQKILLTFYVEEAYWDELFTILDGHLQKIIKENAAVKNSGLLGPDQLAYQFNSFLLKLQEDENLSFKKFDCVDEAVSFYKTNILERNSIGFDSTASVADASPIQSPNTDNNNINHEENTMPLYPDIAECPDFAECTEHAESLRLKLEVLRKFIVFSEGKVIFDRITSVLQNGPVNYRKAELEIDTYIKNLVQDEINNIEVFIALIDDHSDSQEKQQLNSRLSIKRDNLSKGITGESVISVSDINYLSERFSNRSSQFMSKIKNILNAMEVEKQYEAMRQSVLEKFNKIEQGHGEDGVKYKDLISNIVYFYQVHNSFKHLLSEFKLYLKQRTLLKLPLSLISDEITLVEKELACLEENISEKIQNFDPCSENHYALWEEIGQDMEMFRDKLDELREANKRALMSCLDGLNKKLNKIEIAHTFASVLAKREDLQEAINSLHGDVEKTPYSQEGFNTNYKQYLDLETQVSNLTVFSSLKNPFCDFFTKTKQQRQEIAKYKNKLDASVNQEAINKADKLGSILQQVQAIKNFEADNTKPEPSLLSDNVKKLVNTIEANAPSLAKHRNTALKSAFWCLFGFFRPETTSMRLIKQIKGELNEFDTSVQKIIKSTIS